MNIGIAEQRPPYVVFETRSMEDRQASIDAGRIIYKDVDFAIITPQGSKDRIEQVALEWLVKIEKEAGHGRFHPDWPRQYRRAYQDFLEDKDPQVDGTPLKDWPILSPAQIRNFNAINLRSVEDIATANEETIMRMGMGARDLQNRARNYLKVSSGDSKVAENVSRLESENEGLRKRNEELSSQMAQLAQRLSFLEANGGGQIAPPMPKEDENGDVNFS